MSSGPLTPVSRVYMHALLTAPFALLDVLRAAAHLALRSATGVDGLEAWLALAGGLALLGAAGGVRGRRSWVPAAFAGAAVAEGLRFAATAAAIRARLPEAPWAAGLVLGIGAAVAAWCLRLASAAHRDREAAV